MTMKVSDIEILSMGIHFFLQVEKSEIIRHYLVGAAFLRAFRRWFDASAVEIKKEWKSSFYSGANAPNCADVFVQKLLVLSENFEYFTVRCKNKGTFPLFLDCTIQTKYAKTRKCILDIV